MADRSETGCGCSVLKKFSTSVNKRLQCVMSEDNTRLLTWVPRLRRYARALARSRDDADDLVQDTLERALSKSSLWRGVSDMRA